MKMENDKIAKVYQNGVLIKTQVCNKHINSEDKNILLDYNEDVLVVIIGECLIIMEQL